jgi:hypothetical protein
MPVVHAMLVMGEHVDDAAVGDGTLGAFLDHAGDFAFQRIEPDDPVSPSMGSAVRLYRTAVRNGSDYCPASPKCAVEKDVGRGDLSKRAFKMMPIAARPTPSPKIIVAITNLAPIFSSLRHDTFGHYTRARQLSARASDRGHRR